MRNLIVGLCFIIIFLIVPIHISNTSELTFSKQEKKEYDQRLQEAIIKMEIKKEYELFYANLIEIDAPCFIQEFYEKLIPEAIESNSLPSVAIAQAAIETGYGRYNKLQNNIFGIKGRGLTTLTKEYRRGKFITIRAHFQYFPTLKDAFNKHSQILKRYGATGYNYKHWIDRLRVGGYATDPRYTHKVNFVIEKYQLHRLDNIKRLQEKISNIGKESCNLPQPFFV